MSFRDQVRQVILDAPFARACEPVLSLLRAGGNYSDEQVIDMLLTTCFDALTGPSRQAPPAGAQSSMLMPVVELTKPVSNARVMRQNA